MIVKVMRIICIADDVNEDDDTFEGIGWICKSGQRQDCPHSSSQAAALSTWKTLHCMFKGSLYLFPVSISSIENISWIVKALNCPWPFVNTERRARASWRELLEVPAPSNKLVKIELEFQNCQNCHLLFFKIGEARDRVSFWQLRGTCPALNTHLLLLWFSKNWERKWERGIEDDLRESRSWQFRIWLLRRLLVDGSKIILQPKKSFQLSSSSDDLGLVPPPAAGDLHLLHIVEIIKSFHTSIWLLLRVHHDQYLIGTPTLIFLKLLLFLNANLIFFFSFDAESGFLSFCASSLFRASTFSGEWCHDVFGDEDVSPWDRVSWSGRQ